METERARHGASSSLGHVNEHSERAQESDALLGPSGAETQATARSKKKQFLIYAFPALLLWYICLNTRRGASAVD